VRRPPAGRTMIQLYGHAGTGVMLVALIGWACVTRSNNDDTVLSLLASSWTIWSGPVLQRVRRVMSTQ
jgi:hypothetical protein